MVHATAPYPAPHPHSRFTPPPQPTPAPADHRTKVNYDLNKVLEGGLEDSIQAMITLDQQEQLKELAETAGS